MSAVFTITRRVHFSETDLAGVMHFSNYLRWMEDAEHAWWRSLGLGVHFAHGDGHLSWPRVAVGCEYFAPLRFEDEVELRLTLTAIGEKSLSYEVEFSKDGRRVALGKTKAACCETRPGAFRAIPIPDFIRAKLET